MPLFLDLETKFQNLQLLRKFATINADLSGENPTHKTWREGQFYTSRNGRLWEHHSESWLPLARPKLRQSHGQVQRIEVVAQHEESKKAPNRNKQRTLHKSMHGSCLCPQTSATQAEKAQPGPIGVARPSARPAVSHCPISNAMNCDHHRPTH